jgi:two-component system response regulator VanR
VRVLIVEDEPYMAEAIRDGLRLEAIAADIAPYGDTALELLGVNAYDHLTKPFQLKELQP